MTKNNTIQWENVSISSPEFIKAEQGNSLSQFLHQYFTVNQTVNTGFIIELAEKHPEQLLRSIRLNRAFLNPSHCNSLLILKEHSNQRLADHYMFFTKLASIEKELYNDFQQTLNKCLSMEVIDVLIWISLWFEEKRASLFRTQQAHIFQYDIHSYVETINYFLTHYLFASKEKIKSTKFYDEQDIDSLIKVLPEAVKVQDLTANLVWASINKAETYFHFLKSTIEIYSFDLNYDIKIENNVAILTYISESELKRWFKENNKLQAWYDYYRNIATELVQYEIKLNPNFIKNTVGIDYEMNIEGAIRNTVTRLVADDFSFINSSLGGVPSESLLTILNGFVSNAWGRYVTPMDRLNFERPTEWLKNIGNVAMFHSNFKAESDSRRLSAFPSRFASEEQMLNIINANLNDSQNHSKQLLNLLSFDITNVKNIDRLRPIFNLSGKPFIKLNNHYFAFNGILGESSSQTNILFNVMESNAKAHTMVTKSEVELLERNVASLFNEAGFSNVLNSIEYKSKDGIQGDFDFVAYESGVLLLIELKRSKFRVHLSEINDEYENSLKKASSQLSKAQKYISEDFATCKEEYFRKLNIKENNFSELKFYPLILSTSLENDHCIIEDKHFKFSLFEFRNVLEKEIPSLTGNKLEDLIMYFLRNEYWSQVEENSEFPDLNKFTLKMPL